MMMVANWRVVAVGCLVSAILGHALELDAAAVEKAAVLTGTVTGVSGQVFFGQVFDGSKDQGVCFEPKSRRIRVSAFTASNPRRLRGFHQSIRQRSNTVPSPRFNVSPDRVPPRRQYADILYKPHLR